MMIKWSKYWIQLSTVKITKRTASLILWSSQLRATSRICKRSKGNPTKNQPGNGVLYRHLPEWSLDPKTVRRRDGPRSWRKVRSQRFGVRKTPRESLWNKWNHCQISFRYLRGLYASAVWNRTAISETHLNPLLRKRCTTNFRSRKQSKVDSKASWQQKMHIPWRIYSYHKKNSIASLAFRPTSERRQLRKSRKPYRQQMGKEKPKVKLMIHSPSKWKTSLWSEMKLPGKVCLRLTANIVCWRVNKRLVSYIYFQKSHMKVVWLYLLA